MVLSGGIFFSINHRKPLKTSWVVDQYELRPVIVEGFAIPAPVGSYNSDWAISFKEGTVKHVYFVAETKRILSSMELRDIEKIKIEWARKYFTEINQKINPDIVKNDVVNDYGKLIDIVGL